MVRHLLNVLCLKSRKVLAADFFSFFLEYLFPQQKSSYQFPQAILLIKSDWLNALGK